MIDDIAMKGKHRSISYLLQKQICDQLQSNQIGIEKTCLLMRELVY